jgi:hypothetical protein
MKIVVENTAIRSRSGISSKTGKPWEMHEQTALLRGERVMGEIRLDVEAPDKPYPVGEYEIDFERSIGIGAYGSITFRPVLKAIESKPMSSVFQKTGTTA